MSKRALYDIVKVDSDVVFLIDLGDKGNLIISPFLEFFAINIILCKSDRFQRALKSSRDI